VNRYFVAVVMMLIIFIVGCNSPNSIDISELEKYDVSRTSDVAIQDDVIFRLVSEKEQYKEGEEVELYGEIEYVGDKEEVTIHHSSSAFLFPMEEKIRGYEIGGVVSDIGLSTTLKQGEPYREEYVKSGGYSPNQDPEDYVNFIQDFLDREDFPPGYYEVNGFADFSFGSEENGEMRERYKIEAKIDFKVLE
jgi:hypothetical protein